MAKNIIIVEDQNDQYAFEAIIRHINLQDNLEVIDTPDVEDTISWLHFPKEDNSQKQTALVISLENLLTGFMNEKYDKVAIVRDMDNSNIQDMFASTNTALKEAYPTAYKAVTTMNTLVPFEFIQNTTGNKITIYFACHFVGINKNGERKGEIEDILKAIKKQPSPIADCVDKHLPECLKMNEITLREKDLVKLWFNNYQRYDQLAKS